MEKNFELIGDKLKVTVKQTDKIFIPKDKERIEVGTYEQETVQMIEPDKIKALREFVQSEKDSASKQIETLKQQLEPIKDTDHIDEKIIEHCNKALSKGSKSFKASMQVLNDHISSLKRKKQLIFQIEHLEKQLKTVTNDLEKMDAAIKK